ncbi:MAG: hypothetical protein HYZ75_13385 [Elusimicrobia bacterium]|nr:hypothetical protein [Elusimicrobiota bacterium]
MLAAALAACLALPAAGSPSPVSVGVHVNDIHDLDVKTHSYSVDLYLWFRWTDPALDPAATLEFINPFETWSQTRQLDHEKPVRAGGELYQVVRVNGRFSRKLRLDDYPFDRQTLVVDFEDHRRGADELEYRAGPDAATVDPALELPGFRIGKPRLSVAPRAYPTAFGDPRRTRPETYSRVRLEVPIERPRLTYAAKLLVPILCVVLCAALMFLFHPRHVDSRVGIGITALLTVVALQITLNDELPEISYLVLMDKVYLGAYLFMISGLGVVVRSTWLLERGSVARAVTADRQALAVLLALYLSAAAWLILSCL